MFENLPTDERKQLQTESKLRFAEVYEKTICALNLSPGQAPCSGGFMRCWRDIMNVWDCQSPGYSYGLFYNALYHVMWNRYPITNLSLAEKELLALVEQALIDEGYAYEVLSDSDSFWVAYDCVVKSLRSKYPSNKGHSARFSNYVYSAYFCKVALKRKNDNSRINKVGMGLLAGYCREEVTRKAFEDTIKRLVPTAVNWTGCEWTDEAFIFHEIHKAHGVDYTLEPEAFDELIDVFTCMYEGRSYDRSLMLLKKLPVSMLPCLWPKDTEKNMERFFCRLCTRVRRQQLKKPNSKSSFCRDVLTKSWAYQQYTNGTSIASAEIKKQMFNVELGV